MEKILFTGANGFLGNNLVRHFYQLGYKVRAMLRPSASKNGISDLPCEFFYGHIDNQHDVQKAVSGCDWVVHTAAVTDQWTTDEDVYEKINVKATIHLAEACLKASVKRMVYVSTANVFGPGTLEEPGTELSGFTLFKADSSYINTKYLAQQYLLEMAESKKLPVVLVNPCFMIGPNDHKPSSGALLLHAFRKRILFYPPGGKNFVYIQDVCKGIQKALNIGRIGHCYLLAGENMSYKKFFQLVKEQCGRKCIFIRLPQSLLQVAAWIAPLCQKLFGSKWRLTSSVIYLSRLKAYYSGEKAETEWNLEPTPIREAIKHTIHWFRENKQLN